MKNSQNSANSAAYLLSSGCKQSYITYLVSGFKNWGGFHYLRFFRRVHGCRWIYVHDVCVVWTRGELQNLRKKHMLNREYPGFVSNSDRCCICVLVGVFRKERRRTIAVHHPPQRSYETEKKKEISLRKYKCITTYLALSVSFHSSVNMYQFLHATSPHLLWNEWKSGAAQAILHYGGCTDPE